MRIALVEDNAGVAQGVENSLEDHGYAVDAIGTGAAAESFLKVQGAALAIVDVILPV